MIILLHKENKIYTFGFNVITLLQLLQEVLNNFTEGLYHEVNGHINLIVNWNLYNF